jgi:hypothetical protein
MMDDHEKLDYLDSQMKYVIHNKGGQQFLEFKNADVSGLIKYNESRDTFTISGQTLANRAVTYWAASPLWRNYSYAGSGLPYANHLMAYENTTNKGTVKLNKGQFSIELQHPSGYYVNQGRTLLKPHVHLHLLDQNKVLTVVIADFFPYRSLTNLPNHPDRTIGR